MGASTDQGYVLHRRRYQESSLIVDFLTRELGRVSAVARGALRRGARLGASLQPLSLLDLGFTGRGELLTLTRAEALAGTRPLTGERLYCLLYVNELVVRMTATHDPNPELFDAYAEALAGLARDDTAVELTLRRFELALLEALGLGLKLDGEADSDAVIVAERHYHYVLERGPLPRGPHTAGVAVQGATLLALAGQAPLTDTALAEAKQLMRRVLHHHLDGRPLASRKLFEAHAGGKP